MPAFEKLVENLINIYKFSGMHDSYENLKNELEVIIINDTIQNSIRLCNSHKPDIVHIMYDDHIIMVPYLNCKKILYTSHFAYITHPHFEKKYSSYFRNIFQKAIQYQDKIIIHAISKEIADKYRKHGFRKQMNVIGNGAREDLFKYTLHPTKKEKSVYIAKIEYRKAQYKYQTIPNIDFVGNYHDSPFHKGSNYIGEWDKHTLYDSLTEYGNLILLSEGEADPLVVKEGLIAGLGVVVSECSSANLDLSKKFITVIPNDKLNDLKAETYDKIYTEQTWNSGLHTMFMSNMMNQNKNTKQITGIKKKQPRHRKDFIRDPGTRKHVQTIPDMHQNNDKFKEIGMLKKSKGRRIISEPRAFEIASFYNVQIKETPTRLGRSSVSIRKQGNIYVLES
jgi:hypothetical protein